MQMYRITFNVTTVLVVEYGQYFLWQLMYNRPTLKTLEYFYLHSIFGITCDKYKQTMLSGGSNNTQFHSHAQKHRPASTLLHNSQSAFIWIPIVRLHRKRDTLKLNFRCEDHYIVIGIQNWRQI